MENDAKERQAVKRPTKTTLRVVVLVDVHHDTPAELNEAVQDLKDDPPYKSTATVGKFGSYSARTHEKAQSVRIVKARGTK